MKGLSEGRLTSNIIHYCIYGNLSMLKSLQMEKCIVINIYMDAENNLIFRYDNTEHHRKLNLPNFPHHKHDGSENNVVSSDAPFLADVLLEISRWV